MTRFKLVKKQLISNINSQLLEDLKTNQNNQFQFIVNRFPEIKRIQGLTIGGILREDRMDTRLDYKGRYVIFRTVKLRSGGLHLTAEDSDDKKFSILYVYQFHENHEILTNVNRTSNLLKILRYIGVSSNLWPELLDLILSLVYTSTKGVVTSHHFQSKFYTKWEKKYYWTGELMLPNGYLPWNWIKGTHRAFRHYNIGNQVFKNHPKIQSNCQDITSDFEYDSSDYSEDDSSNSENDSSDF